MNNGSTEIKFFGRNFVGSKLIRHILYYVSAKEREKDVSIAEDISSLQPIFSKNINF